MSFLSLPYEIHVIIFSLLKPGELYNLLRCNKYLWTLTPEKLTETKIRLWLCKIITAKKPKKGPHKKTKKVPRKKYGPLDPEALGYKKYNNWSASLNTWDVVKRIIKKNSITVMRAYLRLNSVSLNTPNNYGVTPIVYASGMNRKTMVRLLLSVGVDVNSVSAEGNTALMAAVTYGYPRMVRFLLRHNADPNITNKYGYTALTIAIRYIYRSKYLAILQILLANNVDPNVVDEDGYTLLMTACKEGNTRLVKLLLRYNADPNVVNKNGNTVLIIVTQESGDNCKIVKLLLASNADPNFVSCYGYTPLMLASINGYIRIVKFLLSVTGVNVNAVNQSGYTALMLASQYNHFYETRALLRSGADVNAVNAGGYTALMIAREGEQTEIVELLESYQKK